MLNKPVDLGSCDREPIHIIGSIQPIGALIAADERTLTIEFVSQNVADYFGAAPVDLLGRPLAALIGEAATDALLTRNLDPRPPELLQPLLLSIATAAGGRRELECYAHRHDGRIIVEGVELDVASGSLWEDERVRQRIISDLIRPNTLDELARVAAEILREVTGFDRVMIYRFAPDKHGEVIAESTVRPDSFLGLHYPASDIPDPARRHFVLNMIRTIPDIHAAPVPILARGGGIADAESDTPLDLTFSKLRGVAPVHVEYLGNMGVGASLSISLVSNQTLWGLVACHHYGPLHLSWNRMRFCELIGGTVSALLQSLENTVQLRHSIRAEKLAFGMESAARLGRPLVALIIDKAEALMELVGATGLALKIGDTIEMRGTVPDGEPHYAMLRAALVNGIATTDRLADFMPDGDARLGRIAGAAMMELSEDAQDWLILFCPAYEMTIHWAGKPEKIEQRLDDGSVRLSPRGSFALWREERHGRSRPFSPSDGEVLRITRRALFAVNSLDRERAAVAAKARAQAEEARLRMVLLDAGRHRSLGELASALAHELNQPLTAVTNYVNACRKELSNRGLVIPEAVTGLMQNAVTEASRAASLVRRLRDLIDQGKVVLEKTDLHEVIRQGIDLALAASAEPRPVLVYQLASEMPSIWIDPVQIAQVVLNLVRNSLTAMRAMPTRLLTIRTRRVEGAVEVSVADTGSGIEPAIRNSLFEPFHNSTTSGMGIGLSLCRSIVEAHGGQIWIEPGREGTKVAFTLKAEGGA